MFTIRIDLVGSDGPPTFRLFGAGDRTVKLLEIRVTEAGQEQPSWRAVHELMVLGDELAQAQTLTRSAADAARVAKLRFRDEATLEQTAVAVENVRYGETPAGLREIDAPKPLTPGSLYVVTVAGNGFGELDFYA